MESVMAMTNSIKMSVFLCKTRELFGQTLDYLQQGGFTWASGHSLTTHRDYYKTHESNTCLVAYLGDKTVTFTNLNWQERRKDRDDVEFIDAECFFYGDIQEEEIDNSALLEFLSCEFGRS